MIWIALLVVVAWLTALTVLLAGLVRNVASIDLARNSGTLPVLDLDAAGPKSGELQVQAVGLLQSAGASLSSTQVIIFISPTCGTCLELATEISERPSTAEGAVICIVGDTLSPEYADLRRRFSNVNVRGMLTGEDSRSLMRSMSVGALPYGVIVSSGSVSGSAYLRVPADLEKLSVEGAQIK